MRLNLRAICHWEQMSGKAYSSIQIDEGDDLLLLVYAMYICADNPYIDLEGFRSIYTDSPQGVEMRKSAEAQIICEGSLCSYVQHSAEVSEGIDDMEEYQESIKVSDMVCRLAFDGHINLEYLMERVRLMEVGMLMDGLTKHQQEELERERLWCYMNLSPHIDHEKVKSPKDLLLFPHEAQDISGDAAIQDELYSLLMS